MPCSLWQCKYICPPLWLAFLLAVHARSVQQKLLKQLCTFDYIWGLGSWDQQSMSWVNSCTIFCAQLLELCSISQYNLVKTWGRKDCCCLWKYSVKAEQASNALIPKLADKTIKKKVVYVLGCPGSFKFVQSFLLSSWCHSDCSKFATLPYSVLFVQGFIHWLATCRAQLRMPSMLLITAEVFGSMSTTCKKLVFLQVMSALWRETLVVFMHACMSHTIQH